MSNYVAFVPFEAFHIGVIAAVIIGSSLIIFSSFYPRQFIESLIRYGILVGLILHQAAFTAYFVSINQYDLTRFLPFHLCTLSLVLAIFSLSSFKARLIITLYFWALAAVIITILLPDVDGGIVKNIDVKQVATNSFWLQIRPTFRLVEFFFSHTLILFGVVYLWSYNYLKIKYKDIWISYGILVIAMLIVMLINQILGSNYMYLVHKPNGGQMNFLAPEPFHIVGLMIIVNLVFHLEFGLYKLIKRKS